jgi:hypothetical protein
VTRLQLGLLAVLSLVSTGLVLVAGASGGGDSADVAALVADRRPVTVGGGGGGGSAAAGAVGSVEGGAPDEVGTFDTGGVTEEPVAEAPVAEAPAAEAEEGGEAGEGGSGGSGQQEAEDEPAATKIRHVFVISLAGQGFDATFGPGSSARYLNETLRPQGVLLDGWRSLGSAGLPDLIAAIGGQPPNADTRAGCPAFREIPPTTRLSRAGEVTADGCVYPNTVATLGDQLTARGQPWRAYVEDVEKGPAPAPGVAPPATCRRPASNAADETLRGRAGDGYATRLNPFVYFHSLLDLGDCDAKVGALGLLERDLASARSTPAFSFVAPNLCNSGAEAPCADGSPGGLAAADAFLAAWVPRILDSAAYRAGGLLVVTFAGGPPATDASAADAPVRNGALLVSGFAQAGSTAGGDYDPYSLLRSIEDLLALRPLARAATARSFAPTVLGRAFIEAPSDG